MLVVVTLLWGVHAGWFGREDPLPPPTLAAWLNATMDRAQETIDAYWGSFAATYNEYGQAIEMPTFDGWLWTLLDTLLGVFGWAIFGNAWQNVRSGFSWLIRVGAFLCVCVLAHYVWALCWPLVSLCIGLFLTVRWVVRGFLKLAGRISHVVQRMAGRVPEAVTAQYIGPGVGKIPETSDLRKFKKGATGERWVIVKRDGLLAIFQVSDSASIKSSGLYLSIEPDTLRGDDSLLKDLAGHDKVHLCRTSACTEEGQCFKIYAIADAGDMEKFHLGNAAEGAHRLGTSAWSWVLGGAKKVAKKAADFGSESETETQRCRAFEVKWETSSGTERLSDGPCKAEGCVDLTLLAEDDFLDGRFCKVCPKHCAKYLQGRLSVKCAVIGRIRVGQHLKDGTRFCEEHVPQDPVSRTKRPRSRSVSMYDPGPVPRSTRMANAQARYQKEPHPRALQDGDEEEPEAVEKFFEQVQDGYETDRDGEAWATGFTRSG